MAFDGIKTALAHRARVERVQKLAATSPNSALCVDWRRRIIDLIPAIYPKFERPSHMAQYGAVIDAACVQDAAGSDSFHAAVVAAPPQHSKTTLTVAGILKAVHVRPGRTHMYVSYSQIRTDTVEREAERVFREAGVKIDGTKREWYLPDLDSRIIWTSIGGLGSGVPVDGLLVIDDPFRDIMQARSAVERETRWDWLMSVALARTHRTTWVILMSTRWHEDDLSGRAIERLKWNYYNIQAEWEGEIDGTGRQLGDALWPLKHPKAKLDIMKQADPLTYAALYQGRPRPLGDALFDEPATFIDLPHAHTFVNGYGVDLAYSKKTVSDYNVCVKGRRYGDLVYVLGMKRKQCVANDFLPTLKAEYQGCAAPMLWYAANGPEMGVASFISPEVPGFTARAAVVDKVMRSANLRQGWKLRRVLLPHETSPYFGPWVKDLRHECGLFTGVDDAHDDIVDALAALWDQLVGCTLDWGVLDRFQGSRPKWSY